MSEHYLIVIISGIIGGAIGKFIYDMIFGYQPPAIHVPPLRDDSYKYDGKGFCENSPWQEFKPLTECNDHEILQLNFMGIDYLVTEYEYTTISKHVLPYDGAIKAHEYLRVHTRKNKQILKERERRHPYNCC